MDELDDRSRAELFGRVSERPLPGGVQVLEVAIECAVAIRSSEGRNAVQACLQGGALVDEPPEQATDGEIGACGRQDGREAELLGDDRFVDDQQREGQVAPARPPRRPICTAAIAIGIAQMHPDGA